jgi:hypothetical protein
MADISQSEKRDEKIETNTSSIKCAKCKCEYTSFYVRKWYNTDSYTGWMEKQSKYCPRCSSTMGKRIYTHAQISTSHFKILKSGVPKLDKEPENPQATCGNCGCIFEYAKQAIEKDKGYGNVDERTFVRCPQPGCNKIVVLTCS